MKKKDAITINSGDGKHPINIIIQAEETNNPEETESSRSQNTQEPNKKTRKRKPKLKLCPFMCCAICEVNINIEK